MAFSSLRTYNSQCRIFLLFCNDILDVYPQFLSCKYSNNCTKLSAMQIFNKQRMNKIFHRRTKLGNFTFGRLRSETKTKCFPSIQFNSIQFYLHLSQRNTIYTCTSSSSTLSTILLPIVKHKYLTNTKG